MAGMRTRDIALSSGSSKSWMSGRVLRVSLGCLAEFSDNNKNNNNNNCYYYHNKNNNNNHVGNTLSLMGLYPPIKIPSFPKIEITRIWQMKMKFMN